MSRILVYHFQGEQVSDVVVAAWSKRNARLFVFGLRQALESDHVTMHLHQWIDLIFGCKQTGKYSSFTFEKNRSIDFFFIN